MKIISVILTMVVIAGAGYWLYSRQLEPNEVACTLEARLCPDGTAVGRSGPKCEFAPCPGEVWKSITDAATGISFSYPEKFLTQYIKALDWPPQVQLLNEKLSCIEAGSETARAGKTEKRMMDDRTYCRTMIVEGAAGSVYTQYAYAFPVGNQTVIFTFSVRAPQCENYDEFQKSVCEEEKEAFDLDGIVDRMAQSVRLSSASGAGIVNGYVHMGPTCPVVREGEDCTDSPYAVSIEIHFPDERLHSIIRSGSDGRFSVRLLRGSYLFRPQVANVLPVCEEERVIVAEGKTTQVDISCDSGIR